MKRFLTMALALVMMLAIGAFALELDTAETANEIVVNDTAVLSSAVTDPANEVHATYGKLVYYQDFQGSGKTPTYVDPTIKANSSGSWNYSFANCTGSVVADPTNPDGGNKVALIKGTGSHGYARLVIQPKLRNCYGKYTVVMDFYCTTASGHCNVDCMPYLNGTQKRAYFDSVSTVGSWVQNSKGGLQFTLVKEGEQNLSKNIGSEFTELYLLNNKGTVPSTDYMYIDNVKIYFDEQIKFTITEIGLEDKGITSAFLEGTTTSVSAGANYGKADTKLSLPGYTFLGWYDENGNKVETLTNDAVVSAKWSAVTPGINLLTGTTELATYEDGKNNGLVICESVGMSVVESPKSIGDNAVTGNDSKYVLKSSVSNVRYVAYSFNAPVEKGRKYKITWSNYYYSSTNKCNYNESMGWLLNYKGSSHVTVSGGASSLTAYKWYTRTYNEVAGGANKIRLQMKFAHDSHDPSGSGYTTNSVDYYLDNVGVYPYYIITYYGLDGTAVKTEQVLAESYTPSHSLADTANKKFIGWSTSEGATTAMSSVALANADVNLYPVYVDAYTVSYYGFDGNVAKTDKAVAGEYTPNYVLADEESKYFEGWALEGTTEAVASITVSGDIKLVPVYTTTPPTLYVSANGSDSNNGSENAPFATLSKAYTKLHDGTVIVLLDNTSFVNPPAHNGALTIKGASSSVTLTLPSEVSLAGNLKLDNLKLSAATIYANGYALEITSSVTSTGSLTVYGGKNGAAYTGDTDVKIFGGTYSKIFGGNNNAALTGKTSVTFGGNAKTEYIFGAGNSANGTATETNVYVTGGTINEAVYGGTHFGTAAANGVVYNITMTGGKTQAIFGGSIGASVNGHVFVNLLGGEVTRRVYTGCYNDTSGFISLSYSSDYYVTGTTVLRIASEAKLVTGSDSNRGIFSGSRTASQHDDEQNTIIFVNDSYSAQNGKIGEKGSSYKKYFNSFHDYVVQAGNGGDVLGTKTAGKVYIAPDEGKWGMIGTSTYYNEEASVSASTAITFVNHHTVTYYGFDGEAVKSEEVLEGNYALDLVLADENGKYFEGWKVEGTDEIVTSVNVEADVKLYPVYTAKAEDAVENVEGNEMRFDVVDGNVVSSIRFKAVISASERNAADEYGFIVTRKTFLDTMAEKAANGEAVETDLTFDFKFGGNNLFAYGAAYVADSDLDLNLGEDENGAVTFAAALSGIKNNDANHANEVMVARPYVKFTNNGKQYVFYGAKASASLVDVAKSVDTTNLPENYKKNIEDIVALAK